MALVVEEGTGLSNANSYVTIAELDTYWEDRNSSDWSDGSDEEKLRAALDAARYVDYVYRFIGTRRFITQSMSWPRWTLYLDADDRSMPTDEIPQRIKDAQCELALESLVNGSLLVKLERGGRESSVTVGPLSVSYFDDASGMTRYPVIDALLADVTMGKKAGSLTANAVRA